MSLNEIIKQICTETVEANKPVNIVSGSVVSIDPFKIKIDQRLVLTSSQLVMGSYADLTFQLNDWVTMLRVQGGKKYYIVDAKCCHKSSGLHIDYNSETESLGIGD